MARMPSPDERYTSDRRARHVAAWRSLGREPSICQPYRQAEMCSQMTFF